MACAKEPTPDPRSQNPEPALKPWELAPPAKAPPALDPEHLLYPELERLRNLELGAHERSAAVAELYVELSELANCAAPIDAPIWVECFEELRRLRSARSELVPRADWWAFFEQALQRSLATPSAVSAHIAWLALLYPQSYPTQIATLREQLAQFDPTQIPGLAWAMTQAAEAPQFQGDYSLAASWLARAQGVLAQAEVAGEDVLERGARAAWATQAASYHIALGQYDAALQRIEEAQGWLQSAEPALSSLNAASLERVRALRDQVLLIRLTLLTDLQRPSAALELSDAASQRALSAGYAPYVAYYRGVALHALGNEDGALASLQEALAASDLSPVTRGMALLERASLELERDRADALELSLQAAREHLQQHPELELQSARLEGLEAWSEAHADPSPQGVARALERARVAQARFLGIWDRAPTTGAGVGFLAFAPRRFLLGQLLELELRAAGGVVGKTSALQALLEAQARGTLARRLSAQAGDLERIRRDLLSEGEGLLLYMPAWRGSHLFALDANAIVHVPLPASEQLGDAINAALAELRDGRTEQALSDLSPLLLPAEILPQLRSWRSVTIVGADLLRHLPLEALPIAGEGRLGLMLPVAYLPSVAVGLALHERGQPAAAQGLRVLHAPTLASALERRYSLSEIKLPTKLAKRLERAYQALAGSVYAGPAALRDNLVGGEGALVLFAHGVLEPMRARPTGIALSSATAEDGDCLYGDELAHLWQGRPTPPLVALFACGTANTVLKVGDGDSESLGAAFLENGSLCVVASAEALHQEASGLLLAVFLEGLARGASPAQALLLARREVAAVPAFGHPHYWATLSATGLGHRNLVSR